MQAPNFTSENLLAAVSRLRPDGKTPVLDTHFQGGQCQVFKVDFSDGESWAVRIPLFAQVTPPNVIISQLQGEVRVVQELERRGFRWAAKPQGSSLMFENEIGTPFVALTWILGTQLQWSSEFPARPIRDMILSQIASIQQSLIECTKEQRDITATEEFERIIDSKVRRIRNGRLPELTEKDCFDQKYRLPGVLYPQLNEAPFAMDHGDLSPRNIIINSEQKITGIIDWGFASKTPIQLAAGIPRFLRPEPPLLPLSPVIQKDRETYIMSLQVRSSQAAAWMTLVQSSSNADFRACFMESIISKGMHRWMADHEWKLPHHEVTVREESSSERID
ncbi:hypothetical protein PT974_12326 [Cladobotryum mycophilum]|uniref:Aminoglycoside phosphotransferase domain-containing protein n=1 Tax=Cladobotryum mycophilum TaxID=491253 RepID=A0ABR0S8M8_9HYPO